MRLCQRGARILTRDSPKAESSIHLRTNPIKTQCSYKRQGDCLARSSKVTTYLAMKVNITDEQWKSLDAAMLYGALEGAAVSSAISIPAFYYLHRRSAWYRSLPFSIRVASVIIVVGPILTIQAERRSLEYDRTQWCVLSCGLSHACLPGTYPIMGR